MTKETTQGEEELRKRFEANLLDGDDIQDGQLVSAKEVFEFMVDELTKARLEGAASYVTITYGERCEVKDTDEFPGIDKDPKATRCLICREWEYYDEWASSLTTQLKKGE